MINILIFHFFSFQVKTISLASDKSTHFNCKLWGRRGRGRLVVGFTTIHAISAYHH